MESSRPEEHPAIQPARTRRRAERRWSLHWYLLALCLATLLPGLLGVVATIGWANSSARETALQRLSYTAQTIAGAVESDIEFDALILNNLGPAMEPTVKWPDAAHLWSRSVQDRMAAAMIDAEQGPDGSITGLAGSGVDSRWVEQALRTGLPTLSNLFEAAEDRAPLVAMVIPDSAKRGRAHVFSMPPRLLVRALNSKESRLSELQVTVIDGNGRVIAHSHDSARAAGTPMPDWSRMKAGGLSAGVLETTDGENQPLTAAYHELRGTPGWMITVGEPTSHFVQHWRRPLMMLALGSAAALVLVGWVCWWIGRRILEPVQSLATHGRLVAREAGTRTATRVAPTSIREFEDLRRSLVGAELALRRHVRATQRIAEQLATSERRYRAQAETGALVLWRGDEQERLISVTGWRELTGQDERQALGSGWRAQVHPEDLHLLAPRPEHAGSDTTAFDVELRVRGGDGLWHWNRVRGCKTVDPKSGRLEWVGVIEDVDARRNAQARAIYLAHHDALTGLANRNLLRERLDEAVALARRGRMGAVLWLDLDRFKQVNDTHGHPVGDALLRAVAERLLGCVRSNDLVARLGGDEFAIIQVDAEQPHGAAVLAQRLVTALTRPFDVCGHALRIGVSVGVAVLDDQVESADAALKCADLAMYRAKDEGGSRHRFFELEMDRRMRQQHQLELELRLAVREHQFVAHFQPLIHLGTNRMVGFEALVRWNHPTRGLLLPAEFVPALEELGLIVQVGNQVLRMACAAAATWPRHLKVAVNVSPVQLAREHLAESVHAALADSGLEPNRLELEITENALLANIQEATTALLALKASGVSIVMDDFGTGHSSVGHLREFPFDKVKIDRSFVRGMIHEPECRAIVRAVTVLCESLSIATTAEGVEDEEQLRQLRIEGCSEVQGFLFGQPMTEAQVTRLLALGELDAHHALLGNSRHQRSGSEFPG